MVRSSPALKFLLPLGGAFSYVIIGLSQQEGTERHDAHTTLSRVIMHDKQTMEDTPEMRRSGTAQEKGTAQKGRISTPFTLCALE